jgi:hypothetical protein
MGWSALRQTTPVKGGKMTLATICWSHMKLVAQLHLYSASIGVNVTKFLGFYIRLKICTPTM